MSEVLVKYIDAYLPELSKKEGDCGFDLRCVLQDSITLEPNETYVVPTGVSIAMPNGVGGFVYPRSGLGCKGLVLRNLTGVIDSNYRGEIKVCLWNTSSTPITIQPYDRIAQLVFLPYITPALKAVDTLPSSERGEGGFGSTGVK